MPRGRTADHDAPLLSRRCERALPGRLSDRLDDDVCAAAGGFLHSLDDVALRVVHGDIGTQRTGLRELLVARRRDDRACPERATDLERRERDPAADAPDEHPLALPHGCLGHEHAVRGLEYEWEGGALLEGERVVEWVELRDGDCLELTAGALRVLSDHGDAVTVRDAGVDDDALPDSESVYALAELCHHACSVGAEDARLRDRRETLADPDVEMIQSGRAQRYEHFVGARFGIGDILVAEDLRATVLVDSDRLHGAESSHDRRRAEPAGCGARARRSRSRHGPGIRRHGGPHPRAARARALRRHALHHGSAGDLVPSRGARRGGAIGGCGRSLLRA